MSTTYCFCLCTCLCTYQRHFSGYPIFRAKALHGQEEDLCCNFGTPCTEMSSWPYPCTFLLQGSWVFDWWESFWIGLGSNPPPWRQLFSFALLLVTSPPVVEMGFSTLTPILSDIRKFCTSKHFQTLIYCYQSGYKELHELPKSPNSKSYPKS